jgi:hypothetical protein
MMAVFEQDWEQTDIAKKEARKADKAEKSEKSEKKAAREPSLAAAS